MTLELQILLLLRPAGELLTPEEQLRSDLRLTLTPAPRVADIHAAFDALENRRPPLAMSTRDTMTGSIRWRITEAGRLALAERGL